MSAGLFAPYASHLDRTLDWDDKHEQFESKIAFQERSRWLLLAQSMSSDDLVEVYIGYEIK